MSVYQGDLIALDTAIFTLTGVCVTLFSVMFTVMSTPVSDRLNTPLSPPTKAYEASDMHVYSCHSLVLEYTQLCCDRLVKKLKENKQPFQERRAVTFNATLTLVSKKSNIQCNSDHFKV